MYPGGEGGIRQGFLKNRLKSNGCAFFRSAVCTGVLYHIQPALILPVNELDQFEISIHKNQIYGAGASNSSPG